jgi:hypothetical protein
MGDGLYAAYDGWQIELYSSNGLRKTNRVYLEPAVLAAFLRWVEQLKAEQDAALKKLREEAAKTIEP